MTEYIEREALDKALTIAAANGKDKDRRTWAKAICVLHDAPAADVAPVVHGLWKPAAESEITGWNPGYAGYDPIGGYFCSNCSYEAIFTCNDEYELSAYCPNCGAKMDGGDNDAAD